MANPEAAKLVQEALLSTVGGGEDDAGLSALGADVLDYMNMMRLNDMLKMIAGSFPLEKKLALNNALIQIKK